MDHIQRARVRAGDPEAFGMLFDDYARAVYNLAFRLTGNWSTAEEVVSLTFLEAWRLRGRVAQAGGPLRPWLLGIAVNVTRNLTRAARRHQAALRRLPGEEAVPDFADELAGRIDDSAALRRLAAGLAALRRPSGMCSRCACGPAWTTRRRPARWVSRSGPCAPGCPGPATSSARRPRPASWRARPGSPRPTPLTALTADPRPAQCRRTPRERSSLPARR